MPRGWARDLKIDLYPTVVFFDARGKEAFRFDGYLRPFHIESAFDYVASGAYGREPQFQRFVQARAEQAARAGQAGRPVAIAGAKRSTQPRVHDNAVLEILSGETR